MLSDSQSLGVPDIVLKTASNTRTALSTSNTGVHCMAYSHSNGVAATASHGESTTVVRVMVCTVVLPGRLVATTCSQYQLGALEAEGRHR